MSELKHTPGPWSVVANGGHSYTIRGSRNEAICDTSIWLHSDPHSESRANAHLIAAAPDLLEALEDLLTICDGDPDEPDEIGWARAAIAKAKGESHE